MKFPSSFALSSSSHVFCFLLCPRASCDNRCGLRTLRVNPTPLPASLSTAMGPARPPASRARGQSPRPTLRRCAAARTWLRANAPWPLLLRPHCRRRSPPLCRRNCRPPSRWSGSRAARRATAATWGGSTPSNSATQTCAGSRSPW